MQILSLIMSIIMMFTSSTLTAGITQEAGITSQSTEAVSAELFSDQIKGIMTTVITNIVNEAKEGTSDSQEVLDAINSLPVYEEGEEKPHHKEVNVSPLKKAINKALNDLINNVLEPGTIRNFLNNVTKGMYDMYIYLIPIDGEENIYYIVCDYIKDDGEVNTIFTGIRYNKETGKLYGKDNNGLMGIGFDYDAKNYLITTPVNVWMRDMGYSVLYDIIGNMGFMNTDTIRIKFEHGGKHWMFQLWKGNYGFKLMNGAEVGIYNKTDKNAFSYNCATNDEMLNMSLALKTDKETIFEREETLHWWMCGFRFGPGLKPSQLTLESTIQFEDEGMLNAFLEAAKEYSDVMTVTADEAMKVTITW